MEPPKPLPEEAMSFLREGINLTLSRWSALQMAVENEWGGRNSLARANELCEEIFNWFTQSKGISPFYRSPKGRYALGSSTLTQSVSDFGLLCCRAALH